ncbi:MAG: rhodanese-like domain-containing protein [Actinobacteria bacterium]|nr:rhodanese-like domain-containing protein [Actinomycetota bacterium]
MDAPEVTTDDLAAAQGAGAGVLDVRTDEEWASGHVPGARHIPLDDLPARWEELPRDGRIYVICAAGGRSMRAATALIEAGLDAVSVAGGTKQWIDEGRPVE